MFSRLYAGSPFSPPLIPGQEECYCPRREKLLLDTCGWSGLFMHLLYHDGRLRLRGIRE